jgi:hypothetical protein
MLLRVRKSTSCPTLSVPKTWYSVASAASGPINRHITPKVASTARQASPPLPRQIARHAAPTGTGATSPHP